MIPYEELVTALANWRERQGLPPLHSDFFGAPRQRHMDTSSALGDDGGMEPTNIINLDDAGAQAAAGLYDDDVASWDEDAQADSDEFNEVDEVVDEIGEVGDDAYAVDSYQQQPYGGQQYGGAYGAPDAQQGQYAQHDAHGQQNAYGQTPYGQQNAYGQTPYGQPDAYGQTPYGQQDAHGQAQYGQPDAYGQVPHAQPGQYGHDSGAAQAYDPGQYGQPYGQPSGYGDPNAYGGADDVAEEPTRMTYALQASGAHNPQSYSSPGQPYPAPSQPMGGVVDEREESTVIGAMLSPGAPAPGQSGGYDTGGGVPSEPVYDSLAAAAEYQAEQNYDQDYGPGELATNAYQPLTDSDYGEPGNYGQPYDPGAFSGGASEQTYMAPGMQPSAGGEPPPLEPPPDGDEDGDDDDDFMINFDEDK